MMILSVINVIYDIIFFVQVFYGMGLVLVL